MATALHLWFVMCGYDDTSADTTEVNRLTGIGTDLLSIADVHLTLLTNRAKPEATDTDFYNQWNTLTAQMAAELYQRTGQHGFTEQSNVGGMVRYMEEYSKPLMRMIYSLKRLHST